jgi:hypothetical protein
VHPAQVAVNGVPSEIEQHLNHPPAREHGAVVLGSWVCGSHSATLRPATDVPAPTRRERAWVKRARRILLSNSPAIRQEA